MADHDRDEIAGMVLGAWDTFLGQTKAVDLDRPSRLPGWRVHDGCVHLGSWPDHEALADLIRPARTGGRGEPPDADARVELGRWRWGGCGLPRQDRQPSAEKGRGAPTRRRRHEGPAAGEGPDPRVRCS